MTDDQLVGRAAGALVDESAVEMTTEGGGVLEVWTISQDGRTVRGSAPRLEVRTGMELRCRLMIDGAPHQIRTIVEQAEFQSQSRAALILRVTDVAADGEQRRSKRVEAALSASVTALVCDRLVPGETLSAVLDDLSQGGMALAVADMRARAGDRLRVRARAFEGTIDTEVRVMSTRAGDTPGTMLIGCAFIDPSPQAQDVVSRLLERLDAPAAGPPREPNVRAALGIADDPAPAPAPLPPLSQAPLHRPGLA
jgi:PilZ domain